MDKDDKDKLTLDFNQNIDQINDRLIAVQDRAYQLGFARGNRIRMDRQIAILRWANTTFGEATASNTCERIRRFAEEAIELVQSTGLDKQALLDIVDHVYAKPAGNVAQEIGQVGVSLLGLSEHLGIPADDEEQKEFDRIQLLPSDYWQARQNAKAGKGLGLASEGDSSSR